MKIMTLLTLPALLLVASTSYGQTTTSAATTTPADSAKVLTREMSSHLQLNEGQYIKLYSINRTRLARQREIEQATAKDNAARTEQLAELQMQYEQECARLLTPSQLTQLQQDQNQASTDNGQG